MNFEKCQLGWHITQMLSQLTNFLFGKSDSGKQYLYNESDISLGISITSLFF